MASLEQSSALHMYKPGRGGAINPLHVLDTAMLQPYPPASVPGPHGLGVAAGPVAPGGAPQLFKPSSFSNAAFQKNSVFGGGSYNSTTVAPQPGGDGQLGGSGMFLIPAYPGNGGGGGGGQQQQNLMLQQNQQQLQQQQHQLQGQQQQLLWQQQELQQQQQRQEGGLIPPSLFPAGMMVPPPQGSNNSNNLQHPYPLLQQQRLAPLQGQYGQIQQGYGQQQVTGPQPIYATTFTSPAGNIAMMTQPQLLAVSPQQQQQQQQQQQTMGALSSR